jgi:hypothetical protein
MNYRTTWQTEDGLVHLATLKGNETDVHEVRTDCGLVGNAAWEKHLLDCDGEVTCSRCRAIRQSAPAEPETETAPEKVEDPKPAGTPATPLTPPKLFEGADLIHTYSRADALADGSLIDVTPTAQEAGIRYPTALTRAVWEGFVRIHEGVHGQDERGRLWDILWVLRWHATRSSGGDTIRFYLHVRTDDRTTKRFLLKDVCGPADDGSPCITVMTPDED